MLSWLRRLNKPKPSVIGFGKLPGLAEYVRVGSRGNVVSGLEDWLGKSMAWSIARDPSESSKDAFAAAAPQWFMFPVPADDGELVAGVIQPSRDAVGRSFPLLIAVTFPGAGLEAAAHLAPSLLGTFLRDARDLLPRASRVGSESEFRDALSRLRLPEWSVERDTAAYDDWAAGVSPREVFGKVFDADVEHASRQVVHTLIDATAPFRGQESPPTSLGVRLPLAPGLEHLSCFWLHLVRRCAAWRQTIPPWFAATGTPGTMLVQLGDVVPASALADVFESGRLSDAVCDLAGGAQLDASRYVTPLPEKVRKVLQDPSSSLAELLSVV